MPFPDTLFLVQQQDGDSTYHLVYDSPEEAVKNQDETPVTVAKYRFVDANDLKLQTTVVPA